MDLNNSNFTVSDIYPLLIDFHSQKEIFITSMGYISVLDQYIYIYTKVLTTNVTRSNRGTLNLIGSEINRVLKDIANHEEDIVYCDFNIIDAQPSAYYSFASTNKLGNKFNVQISRANYIRMRFLIDSIAYNGGYTKSAKFIFERKNINFIKIDSVKLEASRVINVLSSSLFTPNTRRDIYDKYYPTITHIQNIFIFKSGPKTFKISDNINVFGIYETKDLRIPAPEFVFDNSLALEDAIMLKLNSELLYIVFDSNNDNTTTIFVINDSDNIEKFSAKYIINKENR